MKPQHLRFVRAYLGEANGNATRAAISAGYSARSARSQGCVLLTHPNIAAAIQRGIEKVEMTADDAIRNVAAIASREPKKVSASDVLKANELILKVNGALKDKQGDSRITVNIGFLGQPPATVEVTDETTKGLAQRARVAISGAIAEENGPNHTLP